MALVPHWQSEWCCRTCRSHCSPIVGLAVDAIHALHARAMFYVVVEELIPEPLTVSTPISVNLPTKVADFADQIRRVCRVDEVFLALSLLVFPAHVALTSLPVLLNGITAFSYLLNTICIVI